MPSKEEDSRSNRAIAHQNTFCTAFALTGSVAKSCEAAGVKPNTYYKWKTVDLHGFREKLEAAQEEFGDFIHYLALDTVKNQKPSDNPALKIFMLKAWHSRYKAVDTSVTDDVGKEVMAELKKAMKSEKTVESKPVKEDISEEKQAIEEASRLLASKSNGNSNDRKIS